MKLLLWDIDGTLLDTAGAGLRALRSGWEQAFADACARREFPVLDLAGNTDLGLARALFGHYGLSWCDAGCADFLAAYHGRLEMELSHRPGRVLPGVPALLERLGSGGFIQGLLTGNTAEGAAAKTRAYGLTGYFSFGAYGDDHHDRNALGPIALERAQRLTGRRYPAGQVCVIGDTPRDIACARACGAVSVAVATGRYGRAELAACAPDLLFDDLSDVEAVLDALSRADRNSR